MMIHISHPNLKDGKVVAEADGSLLPYR